MGRKQLVFPGGRASPPRLTRPRPYSTHSVPRPGSDSRSPRPAAPTTQEGLPVSSSEQEEERQVLWRGALGRHLGHPDLTSECPFPVLATFLQHHSLLTC